MKIYSYGKPIGRKIGTIGEYTLYEKTLVKDVEALSETENENGDTKFNFIYGPSAGGLTESVLFNISTTGESIKNMTSNPTFKMRNLKVLNKKIESALPIIERVNGPFSAAHAIAFLSAVEDAAGIRADKNTLMSRIIEIELERIRNHLHVVARMCEAAAFGVPYNSLFYLREMTNRTIDKYAGHRYFFGANGINEIRADFSGVTNTLSCIDREAKDVYNTLLESKIFVDRLQDNGKIITADCVGPVARASGLKFDARLDSQSLPYKELNFSPIVEEGIVGDAMSRFIIRFEEIFRSMELIRKAESQLGRHNKSGSSRSITGEGIGRIESPSGDVAYLVKLNAGKIKKISMLTPSAVNLPAFQKSAVNNVFTDFHFNWESFGIWISEIAVKFV